MKKINFYIIISILTFPFLGLQAQKLTQNQIMLDQTKVRKDNGRVIMDMNVNLDNLDLGIQQMIVLTPIVRSNDNRIIRQLPPVVITGRVRDRVLERSMDFDGYQFEQAPVKIMRRHNNTNQSIPLSLFLPYEDWLLDAGLYMKEDKLGCACDNMGENEYALRTPLLVEPKYVYSYVTPPVEPVKTRSETHTARLNYKLNRYELLRNFENNAVVLDSVDMIIKEIRNDENLTVNNFRVTGYASPEGNEQHNMKLSENRARSFVNYLQSTYSINPSDLQVDWKGEDWEGLRRVVAASNISNRNEILTVLDEPNNLQRKNRLKAINGGETYRMLLRDYYPPLRRNEYTITYVARGFNAEEARQLIYIKPQQLSLNEMFLAANTYPSNSQEFKEIFNIATRMYPNDPVAKLNSATLELENGDIDAAIGQLSMIDLPDAWNNLGIAYALRGDYQQARDYFNRAISSGNQTARGNLAQLVRFLGQ